MLMSEQVSCLRARYFNAVSPSRISVMSGFARRRRGGVIIELPAGDGLKLVDTPPE